MAIDGINLFGSAFSPWDTWLVRFLGLSPQAGMGRAFGPLETLLKEASPEPWPRAVGERPDAAIPIATR
jgi:hypothetical protein